jgi:regulation of enolase protein 1 (concanavalin A-like superfamily)
MSWQGGVWLNEPRVWREQDEVLEVTTDAASDFWRETQYGFVRDSGHFLGFAAPAAFTAQLRVRGEYQALYDQAGLMVRVDEQRWVKAGIELSDGQAMLSSVLTVERSDWATAQYQHDASDFWLRATLAEGVLRLQVSQDGRHWPLLRLAPFPRSDTYRVGPMCCTPERSGLVVRFSEFQLTPPLGKALHDLT